MPISQPFSGVSQIFINLVWGRAKIENLQLGKDLGNFVCRLKETMMIINGEVTGLLKTNTDFSLAEQATLFLKISQWVLHVERVLQYPLDSIINPTLPFSDHVPLFTL